MIFDPDLHEYREDDGTPIPSVTQVLKAAGVIDDRWYTAEARDKGSAVHKLCERYAQGERQDRHGRALADLPYVNAFARWVADYCVWAIATECRVYHKVNGKAYAGTFDLLAEIEGRRELIDIKSGVPARWHVVQLAAYAMAQPTDDTGASWGRSVNPDRIAVLYLKADGTYRYAPIPGSRFVDAIREWKKHLDGN